MQISSATPNFGPPVQETAGGNEGTVLRDEFLRLLVAQIQAQDPLNPQDASEFTAQLAQFSSLEQLIGVNSSLERQAQLQETAVGTAAVSFIGKSAELLSDRFSLRGGQADAVKVNLLTDSASTTVKIKDAAGNTVRTIELGPQSSGPTDFVWDGLNDDGTRLADGAYTVEVTALDGEENTVPVEISTFGVVDSVRFVGGLVLLDVNGQSYTLSELISLGQGAAQVGDPTSANPDPRDGTRRDPTVLRRR